ncbi:MAG: prolyl oligopeptidase, partial [Planctomyces sp.]
MRKLVCLTAVMWSVVCSGGVSTCLLADDAAESEASLPATLQYDIPSSLDGKSQPVLAWAPDTAKVQKTSLFVFLHSWSSDYTQDNSKWL